MNENNDKLELVDLPENVAAVIIPTPASIPVEFTVTAEPTTTDPEIVASPPVVSVNLST